MDDLSNKLNDIKVGCTIGATLINHLMYADDLVLLSPSAMGLSLLLSVCSAYGIDLSDDDDDMARQYRQMYAQGNALLRKFCMCTESIKITLFRSFCTSLYTCELWCQYMSESLRKLCVAYNNVFRFIWREPRNCSASHKFVSRGLPTCNMLIRKSIICFYDIYKAVMQYNPTEHCWQ